MAEDRERPREQGKEEEEDPKSVARAMLIDGYERDDIVEEIQDVTGLPKRTIWAMKGALARSGDIPTKSQLRRMEREKPGPEAQKFQEEVEGVPFRRPRPPHVLIEGILTQFGVKERAKEIIISRCKRAGGMHPSELERSLMDLDTGVNRKEASYVTEEYYLALQAEEDAAREVEGRTWPMRRRESGYGGTYGGRYPEGGQPTDAGYDRGFERRSWGSYDRGREEPLTMRGLLDILERRERDLEDRMRRSTLEDKMSSISEDIGVLATELRNLKENPPTAPVPQGSSDYERSLQHTIDRQDKRHEEMMDILKTERSESKEDMRDFRETSKADMKELRDIYEKRIEDQEKTFKEELDKKGTPHDTTGYKEDAMRLTAEGLHEVADVMRARGSPFRIMVEGLPRFLKEEGRPPLRERGRPASVADLVGPEYVEG
ncbi:MAG: hypothetical protein ACETVR_00415 [Candidatus Bathyarchaeia archaeon]